MRFWLLSYAATNLGVLSGATDRAYIFIAGVALFWVGLAGVGRVFKPVLPEGENHAEETVVQSKSEDGGKGEG